MTLLVGDLQYWRIVQIVKVSNLLLDLELIFFSIICFIRDHDNKISVAIESLMISCTKEMDEMSQPITSKLWVVHNLECIPSIVACKLVSNVFKHCEEKLISNFYKWDKMDDNNKDDALHEENEGKIMGLL